MQHNADTPQKPNQNSNNNNLPQQVPPNPPPLPLPIDFGGKISRVRREIPGILHLINNDEVFRQVADMATQSKIESDKQFKERLAAIEQELAKLKEGDENYEQLQTEKSQLQKYFAEDALEFQKVIDSKFQAGRDELPKIAEKLENDKDFMFSCNALLVLAVEFLHIFDLYNRKDEAKGEQAWKAFERSILPMLNNSVHRVDYKSKLLALAEKYNMADSTQEELIRQPDFYNEGMDFFFLVFDEVYKSFGKMLFAYSLRQTQVRDVELFMEYHKKQYGYYFNFYKKAENQLMEYKDIIGEVQYEKAMGWIKAQREAFYASDETSCDFCKHKFSEITDLQSFVNVFKKLRTIERNRRPILEASDDALMDFIHDHSFNESLSLFSFEEIEKCFDIEIAEESFEVEDTEEGLGIRISDELIDIRIMNTLFGEVVEDTDEIMRWSGDLEEFIDIFRQMNTPTDFEDAFFSIEVDALAKILDERFVWTQNDLPLGKVQLMRLYDEPYTGAYKHDVRVLMKG